MLYTNSSELYDILKSVVQEEFEGERAEEIISLLWKMFSEYVSSEANEKDGKMIEKIMEKVDEYFESSESTDIREEV